MSKKILLAMPEGLVSAADERARAEHRTRSDLFREAVRRYLQLSPPASPNEFRLKTLEPAGCE